MPAKSRKRARKGKKLYTVITAIILVIAALLLLYDKGYFQNKPAPAIPEGSAQVHFIDVGQGDCELLISDDGSTMLIDCGEAEYSADVLRYLDGLGIDKLDYLLISHPHSDHMGGMADIVSSDIAIGTIIMPRVADDYIPTTNVYERFLDAVVDKGYSIHAAKTESVAFGSGELQFITIDYSGGNMNNYSVIVKFTFGENSFLFSGDAEAEIEKEIVAAGYDISADVYKAGHHGSSTSSSAEWLAAVKPQYCVIECGAGNIYGHPHEEALKRIGYYADVILRTDLNGTVVFTSDGRELKYETSRQG